MDSETNLNKHKLSKKTLLLSNGKQIPIIGIGTFNNINDIENTIKYSYEAGYRLIDSAVSYKNEEQIGKSIKKLGLKREDLFLTTKIPAKKMSFDNTIKQVNQSLLNFDTDYIDLVLLHWPSSKKEDRVSCWKALEQLVIEKKINSIGVSNFLIPHIKDILEICKIKPVVNQIELHPLFYDKETIEFCHKENILIEAYSPFAQMNESLTKNDMINNIAKKYEVSLNQVLVRWNLQNAFIVIPKSTKKERISQNIDIDNFELTIEEMEKLNNMNNNLKVGWDPREIKEK